MARKRRKPNEGKNMRIHFRFVNKERGRKKEGG
jgi:hypothetical protein